MPSSKPSGVAGTGSFPLIVVLFCLAIFSVLAIWAVRGNDPRDISIIEGRLLARFTPRDYDLRKAAGRVRRLNFPAAYDALRNLVKYRSDQLSIEKAASDQFPARLALIRAARAVDRQIINLAYLPLSDPAIPADMQSDMQVLRDGAAIVFAPKSYSDAEQEQIDIQLDNYQAMIISYPRIYFMAYHVDLLPYSPYHPEVAYYPQADGGRSLAYFEDHLPQSLSFASMDLEDFTEYLHYFYRTDIHWNIHGVMKAYADIYDLLADSYPTISPPLEFGEMITFPGIEFMGTARRTFNPIDPDPFEAVYFDLPSYQVLVDGEQIPYGNSAAYFKGEYATEPYYYHFTDFFGENSAFLEYVFENQSNRNLLLIGDSFKIPLQPLIACHYAHTYVINPSLYKNFDLSDFLAQNKVDDILFLGGNNVLFLDPQWAIRP